MKEESSAVDDLKEEIIKSEQAKTDLANASELLLNEKWRRRKTILRERVIANLTTLENLANLYDVVWLKEWINNHTEYVTSVGGQGRKDIVDITKYSIDKEDARHKELIDLLGRR